MAGSLFPSYFQLFYHSAFAPHVATIPTRQWSPGAVNGTFLAWDASNVDADTMITGYVDVFKAFFAATVVFDSYVIYDVPVDGFPGNPVAQERFTAKVGTSVLGGYSKAAQATITMRTDSFNIAKYVGLDVDTGDSFDKVDDPTGIASLEAFIDYVSDITNSFSGRLAGKPDVFLQVSYTLNEKLRRSYREN